MKSNVKYGGIYKLLILLVVMIAAYVQPMKVQANWPDSGQNGHWPPGEEEEVPHEVTLLPLIPLDYRTILLEWEAIYNANGYEIYRSTKKNGTYKKISDVAAYQNLNDRLNYEYIDQSAKTGITYYYKIRAYVIRNEEQVYGEYSVILKAKTKLEKPDVTLSLVDEKTIKLKWKKVPGAKGFIIERSTKSDSGYKKIEDIKQGNIRTYQDTGRTLGKKYYYRVRAYRPVAEENVFSAYSKRRSMTPKLSAPKINSIKILKPDTVEIKWEPVIKAKGYKVYRAKGDGKFKLIKNVQGRTKCSLKVGKLVNGETYTYRIRAYTTKDGKTLNGVYSKNKKRIMNYYGHQWETWQDKSKRIFGKKGFQRYPSAKAAEKDMVGFWIRVWDFDATGKKVTKTKYISAHKKIAPTMKKIFEEIYNGKEKFPIHQVGAYNWRGDNSLSEHCLGVAIDINWTENYFIDRGVILAGNFWKPYENPYSIKPDGDVVRIMNKYGFSWGMWGERKDYMHFSYFGG